MPRHHQKTVGLQRVGLGLGDDGNEGVPGVKLPNLSGLTSAIAGADRRNAAVLKHDVALGRCAVSEDFLSAGMQLIEQCEKFVAVLEDARLERLMRLERVEAGSCFGSRVAATAALFSR